MGDHIAVDIKIILRTVNGICSVFAINTVGVTESPAIVICHPAAGGHTAPQRRGIDFFPGLVILEMPPLRYQSAKACGCHDLVEFVGCFVIFMDHGVVT